jgi:hypothetical protein
LNVSTAVEKIIGKIARPEPVFQKLHLSNRDVIWCKAQMVALVDFIVGFFQCARESLCIE